MIDFHCPTLEDKQWIKEKLSYKKIPSCEYTFGNIFSYNAKMKIEVADVGGFLVTKCYENGGISYCYPVGQGDIKKTLELVIDDGVNSGTDFSFFGLDGDDADELDCLFSDKFNIRQERSSFVYVYNKDDLAFLVGKKYQPKRNHISFFQKNNNWSYETMTAENIPECYSMSKKWLEGSTSEFKSDLEDELKIIKLVFDNFESLDYVGGVLRIDGEVVAYTMGEEMSQDYFCVHFEKAYPDIRGAYPMINQQFVKNELSSYRYIDREDDVGIENLRKAKLSYYPAKLAEKYEARLL